jgi:hypothetical protein
MGLKKGHKFSSGPVLDAPPLSSDASRPLYINKYKNLLHRGLRGLRVCEISPQNRVAMVVVPLALLRIAEHCMGGRYFFESCGSLFLVPDIFIGVPAQCKAAIALADLSVNTQPDR